MSITEEGSECAICHSPTETLFGGTIRCTKCRHISDYGMPPDASGYSYDFSKSRMDYREIIPSDVIRMKQRWEFVLRHAKGKKSLLDYGCAMNHFIDMAPVNHGFDELVGFDTNWMLGRSDERMLDRHYDVITMWHSMEHLYIPRLVVDRIPHKYLFIIIPWAEEVSDERLPTVNIFNTGRHIHLYTRDSLFKVLYDYEVLEESHEDGRAIGMEQDVVGFALRKLT